MDLPDFNISSDIPFVKIKSIEFQNFKAFGDYTLNFMDGDVVKPFSCFYGPNGCGKTTILIKEGYHDAAQRYAQADDRFQQGRLR